MTQYFKRLKPNKSRLSASQYNKLTDMVGGNRDTLRRYGRSDSTGHISRPPPIPPAELGVYRARTIEAAEATDHITCNLIEADGTEVDSGEFGFEIEVYFDISGGSALNEALPRLADDEYIRCSQSYHTDGTLRWYGIPPWQASIDCECDSADLIATSAPAAAKGAMWFDADDTKRLNIYDSTAWKYVELGGHDIATVAGGLLTISAQEISLTEANIESCIDTLANLTSIQGQTVTLANSLEVEAAAAVVLNQDLTTDASPTFATLTASTSVVTSLITTSNPLVLRAGANDDINLQADNDETDYLNIHTESNAVTLRFFGCNGTIVADGGSIGFGNENLSTTGTLGAGATTLTGNLVIPDAGYIGSASDTDAIQIEADGDVVLTQNLLVSGNVTTDRLISEVDVTTYVSFASAGIYKFYAANVEQIHFRGTGLGQKYIAINDTGVDIDFYVEGLNDTLLFYCNAGTDRVGISTSAPSGKVEIEVDDAAAIPCLTLDQNDISEGTINFEASDRGVITGATDSLKSVRVELAGVIYRLALYVDA